jgi:hypothetical protein
MKLNAKTLVKTFALTACAALSLGLSGCSTAQTLAAQFTDTPLPQKVARKLYGTCPSCSWSPKDNCPACREIQNARRNGTDTTVQPRTNSRGLNLSGRGYMVPPSGRMTSSGNPYPVRWFTVDSVPSNDPDVVLAVMLEQKRRIADPELALSYLNAMEAQGVQGTRTNQSTVAQSPRRIRPTSAAAQTFVQPTQTSQPNYPTTAVRNNRASGYGALGY